MAAPAHPEIQHWVLCLTLPLKTLDVLQFSPRPYKWIRYAIGIVVGAVGDLSSSSDSLNIVDYNAGLPAESVALYYYASDDERRRMFPADPNIARTKITSSVATTRRSQFRSEVAERDGHECVLTGLNEVLCHAVHLLAHSKGDTYISTYTQRRSRDHTRGDLVEDIDNVSNGLLLNNYTHVVLGEHVAFLPHTAHLFEPSQPYFLGGLDAPSGTPLRISDTRDWPPDILFDAVYAGAVLHKFGTQTLKDEVTATWKDTFDPGGVMDQAHAGHGAITDARALAAEKSQNQAQERRARHQARGAVPDTFDMLIVLPYILVPREELQATLREAKEKTGGGAETCAGES